MVAVGQVAAPKAGGWGCGAGLWVEGAALPHQGRGRGKGQGKD